MQHFIHVIVKFLLYLRRGERRTWPGTTVGQVVREDRSWNQYLSQCLESGNEERSLHSEGTEQLWREGAEQDQGLKGQYHAWGGNRAGTAKVEPWGGTAGLWAHEIDWASSHQQSEAIYATTQHDQMWISKGHLSFCLEIKSQNGKSDVDTAGDTGGDAPGAGWAQRQEAVNETRLCFWGRRFPDKAACTGDMPCLGFLIHQTREDISLPLSKVLLKIKLKNENEKTKYTPIGRSQQKRS